MGKSKLACVAPAGLVPVQMKAVRIKAPEQMLFDEIPKPQTVGSRAVKLDKKGSVFRHICLRAVSGLAYTPSVIAVRMMKYPRRFVPQDEGNGRLASHNVEFGHGDRIPVHFRNHIKILKVVGQLNLPGFDFAACFPNSSHHAFRKLFTQTDQLPQDRIERSKHICFCFAFRFLNGIELPIGKIFLSQVQGWRWEQIALHALSLNWFKEMKIARQVASGESGISIHQGVPSCGLLLSFGPGIPDLLPSQIGENRQYVKFCVKMSRLVAP